MRENDRLSRAVKKRMDRKARQTRNVLQTLQLPPMFVMCAT
jgi:hypothetical protein